MIYTNLDYNDYKINHNREYFFFLFFNWPSIEFETAYRFTNVCVFVRLTIVNLRQLNVLLDLKNINNVLRLSSIGPVKKRYVQIYEQSISN